MELYRLTLGVMRTADANAVERGCPIREAHPIYVTGADPAVEESRPLFANRWEEGE